MNKELSHNKIKKSLIAPYKDKNIPHAVIEINQKCNIACKACFKNKSNYSKSFDLIKKEIDFALQQRIIDTLTLAGGEPTLHEDLYKIVSYISKKGVYVNMFSNGLLLNDEMLSDLKQAGLFSLHIHIDSKQKRPDIKDELTEKELNKKREEICLKIKNHGIMPGLCVTLYKSTLDQLTDISDYLFSSKSVNNILITLYMDSLSTFNKYNKITDRNFKNTFKLVKSHENEIVYLKEIESIFKKKYNLNYNSCVVSKQNNNEPRWFKYEALTVSLKNGQFVILPYSYSLILIGNFFHELHRIAYKRYPYMSNPESFSKSNYIFLTILSALLSFNIKYMIKAAKFLFLLFKKDSKIMMKSLYFQQFAGLNKDGSFDICESCPDATVRNNMLVPICIADIINPIINDENIKNNDEILKLGLTKKLDKRK